MPIWTTSNMVAEILKNEGGLVDNPADSGDITKYGISLKFAQSHPEYFDLNHDGVVDRGDILIVTTAVAGGAFLRYFFYPAQLFRLPNVSNIMMQIFDLAVNVGVHYTNDNKIDETEAVKVLQHAVGVDADGLLGPQSLAAVSALVSIQGGNIVNNRIVDFRCAFYDQVVVAHPEDKIFLAGWKKRANKYRV